MGELTQAAHEIDLTLEVMLGGGYRAADPEHGVHTTGRTDYDALRRLHTWLEQRALANTSTIYRIRRYGKPGSIREARDYTVTGADLLRSQHTPAR